MSTWSEQRRAAEMTAGVKNGNGANVGDGEDGLGGEGAGVGNLASSMVDQSQRGAH